jgi:hypothetical protein
LDPLPVPHLLAHQLLAGAQQAAQLLGRGVGHEARPDQAVGVEIGQPGGIVHVALAPRHRLDLGRVGEHQGEAGGVQDVPHRLPVDPGRLHRHMAAALGGEPVRQGQELAGRGREGADLAPGLALSGDPQARHHRVLVHIQAGAALMQNLHHSPPCRAVGGEIPLMNSNKRAPGTLPRRGAIGGARDLRVQLRDGLARTKAVADLDADDDPAAYHPFHPRRVGHRPCQLRSSDARSKGRPQTRDVVARSVRRPVAGWLAQEPLSGSECLGKVATAPAAQ